MGTWVLQAPQVGPFKGTTTDTDFTVRSRS